MSRDEILFENQNIVKQKLEKILGNQKIVK